MPAQMFGGSANGLTFLREGSLAVHNVKASSKDRDVSNEKAPAEP